MKRILPICFALLIALSVSAAGLPEKPKPQTMVTDMAGMFSQQEQAQLERKLVDYFAQTSTQIAVVTVPDLEGYDVSDYAIKLGQKWGIGSEKFDNGILVLMKPKNANGGGKVVIAVGYGLEGAVPDATAKQIVENEMIPRFKQNDIFGGVESATNVLIQITKGEYNYQQYAKKVGGGKGKGFNPFILLIILFFVVRLLFGRRRSSTFSSGAHSSLPFWLGMGLLGGAGRNHSGMFGNFSGGSGSFGGGNSFGSFGGFGGGGFGGGGASGSW